MKLLAVPVFVTIAFAPLHSMASIAAGPFVNPANNHTYYLLSPGSWTNSEAEAVALGGHLVTITDAAEQNWVYATFGSHDIWIGLTDRDVEGTFQWISGETSTYRGWVPGEPNNAASGNNNQDYAHVYSNTFATVSARGKWDDRSETETFALTFSGVVEIPNGVPIQPGIVPAVELAWETQSTSQYQVQWSSTLEPDNWFNLGSPIQGTGTTYYHLISTRGVARRFYRVLTLAPQP